VALVDQFLDRNGGERGDERFNDGDENDG